MFVKLNDSQMHFWHTIIIVNLLCKHARVSSVCLTLVCFNIVIFAKMHHIPFHLILICRSQFVAFGLLSFPMPAMNNLCYVSIRFCDDII